MHLEWLGLNPRPFLVFRIFKNPGVFGSKHPLFLKIEKSFFVLGGQGSFKCFLTAPRFLEFKRLVRGSKGIGDRRKKSRVGSTLTIDFRRRCRCPRPVYGAVLQLLCDLKSKS